MRTSVLILLAVLAGAVLLLREVAPDGWALPLAGRLALLSALASAIVLLVRSRAPATPRRWAGAAVVLLGLGAFLHLVVRPLDPEAWRAREEARLRARFETARTTLLGIESAARRVAGEARTLLPDSSMTDLSPEQRAALFESLENLQEHARTPAIGTSEIAIQLFDRQGDLLAWTRSARAAEAGTRLTRMTGGQQQVYLRRTGIYTIFSVELRDAPRDSAAVAGRATPPSNAAAQGTAPADSAEAPLPLPPVRVLVDLPVEVHYPIRNRFLQSRSLAERLSGNGIEVTFTYDARAVPPYLTLRDLELQGDEERGVYARGLLRDASGAPLVLCGLSGLPYRSEIERAAAQAERAMRILLVLAVACGWLALSKGLRASASGRLRRVGANPMLPIAALWSVRFLLAFLQIPSSRSGNTLVNPATFAMIGFGGILRSPVDFLLTALAMAATAAIAFLHIARLATTDTGERRADPWRSALWTLLATALVGGGIWVAFAFVARVAADSNPHLIGSRLELLSPAVLCLETAILVSVASWLVLLLLVLHAATERRPRTAVLVVFVVAASAWLVAGTTVVTAAVGAAILVFGIRMRSLLRDQRFTSFGLASFVLVGLTSILASDAIHREYFRATQARVQEKAEALVGSGDELRRFVLEELLQKVQEDAKLRQSLDPRSETERGGLAFELWAGSMLSHLGYNCEIRIYDASGQLVSDFAVDMPAGPEDPARDLLEEVRAASGMVVHSEGDNENAPVRAYRGGVMVRDEDALRPVGAVLVTLPFSQASLDLAANPRTRTPEVLRNLQDEGIGPRVDESEGLILAWVESGFVVESSTPYLEVGRAPELPPPGTWQHLRLLNGDHLVTRVPGGARSLLAGFRVATPLDRLLDWAQIGSFSFGVTLLVLLLFWGIVRTTRAAAVLPPLLVPKRLGFQQKLMVAFLVVSLLPSVVLSVATRDIMRDRAVRRNRDAALDKARAAQAALADLVRRDLEAVRESEYLRIVLGESEAPPVRDIGHLEFSQIMVFRGDGRIILDETLSNLSDEQARFFVEHAPRTVFASRDNKFLCLGALEKIWFSPTEGLSEVAEDAQPYYVFYRRRLTDRVLHNLAPILSTDISGFLGPHLVVSSQKSLAIAGLFPTLAPPEAYTHVQLRQNHYAVVEERTGRQSYFAGYLPLENATGRRIGALAVSQLLQSDEFAVEVERTRELVLGLSTLMFVLTLVLGVFFAARIFDPVRNLIEGTRRIAGGDLGFRLRARSSDEIGELERSFNQMTSRLQEARRALEERRRYLEGVLGNIASGVVATDAEGRITAANPAAYRILQIPTGTLEGRACVELAAERDALDAFWRRLAEAPAGEIVEIPVLGASAYDPGSLERLTLRVVVTDLRPDDDAGERLGRVAIFEDVTELIRSKKLSAWAEMARQVAHEIKNPLTPMKLSAQFMQQAFQDRSEKFPEIFEEGMATIIQQVESLRRIATEFSNFGRVQKLEPRPLDLTELLRSVTAPYTHIPGLQLEVVDGLQNGLEVLGDAEGLRRVFRNVLENAREAMGGRGRIAMHVERLGQSRVQVRITDQGPGISPEAATRLFEPYFSTKSTGTGLGLAISRSIVEELGGTMQLANRADGGAEACITLVVC